MMGGEVLLCVVRMGREASARYAVRLNALLSSRVELVRLSRERNRGRVGRE